MGICDASQIGSCNAWNQLVLVMSNGVCGCSPASHSSKAGVPHMLCRPLCNLRTLVSLYILPLGCVEHCTGGWAPGTRFGCGGAEVCLWDVFGKF